MYCLTIYLLIVHMARESIQYSDCETGREGKNSCPIDGGWTSWNAWGPCIGECGSKGIRRRDRSCSNPLPFNNGAPCIGPSYETINCQITGCTIEQYENMTHNHPVKKEEMKIVEAVHDKLPALTELCFSVDCPFSVVEKILGSDATVYWNAMNCVKHEIGCPIPGGWSSWMPWSSCSALCGVGQRHRIRICNNPAPSNLKLTCNGAAFQVKNCIGVNCNKHLGNWSNWSSWSTCTASCNSGIKIKKRSCIETANTFSADLNNDMTSCKGPMKKVEPCQIKKCSIDGAWSPWTAWTSCSTNCGIGTQLRNRVCNNPVSSRTGIACLGLPTEIRQCLNKPCSVITHEVSYFTVESSLFYAPVGQSSRLLHMYIRFLPLARFGILIYRYEDNCLRFTCEFTKLFLQNGKVALAFHVAGCSFDSTHEENLEIGEWHTILVAVYATYVRMRIDNGLHKVYFLPCPLLSQNFDHSMKVGDGFHGKIQEIIINFVPLQLRVPKDLPGQSNSLVPYNSNYMQYLAGDDEEGFLHVQATESIAAPCPKRPLFWRITIALRPNDINGVILMIPGNSSNGYILLLLDEGRVKLKVYHGLMYANVYSSEHILLGEWFEVLIIKDSQNLYMQVNGNKKNYIPSALLNPTIVCARNIFIGAIREEIKSKLCPKCIDIQPMSFTFGYLYIDEDQLDLLSLPMLETSSTLYGSRFVSLPKYYEEISLPLGQEFKLSCFYKHPGEQRNVTWLLMDKPLQLNTHSESFTLKDDGHVSSIIASSYSAKSEIENFYSCYIHRYKNISRAVSEELLLTFGVAIIDERNEMIGVPWNEWILAYSITILLLFIIFVWFLTEALIDIKNGYGFYRLPEVTNDSTSINRFILSANGIALLGGQQAAEEIVQKVVCSKKIETPMVKDKINFM